MHLCKDVIKCSWIEHRFFFLVSYVWDCDNRLYLAIIIAVTNHKALLLLQNQNKHGGQTNEEFQISEDKNELLN